MKPAGRAVAEVMNRARTGDRPAAGRPGLVAPDDLRSPDLDRIRYAPGSDFHREWVRLRSQGPVAIVSAERALDPDHLSARGIDDVVDLAGQPGRL